MVLKTVRHERDAHCAFLEIVAPEQEGLTRERLTGELGDVCAELAWEEQLRAVVLFFRGADLRGPQLEEAGSLVSFVESVADLKLPVIAAIQGDAEGLALELAMACDIRIGTTGARFGLPQVQLGRLPRDGGTQRLRQYVGMGKALEMVLLGETIDADEAMRWGLINRIAEPTDLAELARGMAREMASRSPLAMGYVKEAVRHGLDMSLGQGIQMELDMYLHLFSTRDRIEGVSAFREKRVPRFEGE